MDKTTYLTTEELAMRLRYEARYIRENLKDSVLLEGIHYVRPFGRRRILYLWEPIERDMKQASQNSPLSSIVPLARGGAVRG